MEDFTAERARVTRNSTIHIRHNIYSVDSRLMREWVEIRIFQTESFTQIAGRIPEESNAYSSFQDCKAKSLRDLSLAIVRTQKRELLWFRGEITRTRQMPEISTTKISNFYYPFHFIFKR